MPGVLRHVAYVLAALALAALQPAGAVTLRRSVTHQKSIEKDAGAANPIRKVVTLLQNLAKKVEKEADAEKELYDKYVCYCKTGTSDLQTSIGESSTKVPALQSDIETAESTVLKLQQELKQHQGDRTSAKAALQEAKALREKENADYVKESTEIKGYVDSLAKAIPAIESGMSGGAAGLLQLASGVTDTLRRAASVDQDLTDDDRASVIAFLSSGSHADDSSTYVPKGGEIVGILKDMKDTFDKSLAKVEEEEAEAVTLFNDLLAAKSKEIDSLGASIEKKTARVGELKIEIVHMKDDLTDTEASLIEDKKFLGELEKDCDGKAAEFEERVKTRSEELVAIHDTIKILNDDDALDLFKKTLSSASLLQTRTGAEQSKQKALMLIRKAGRSLVLDSHVDVRFLELALMGRKVDFSKVIKMIDDMVALLEQEQVDDEHKKEYCNKQIDEYEDKVKELSRDISDLETSIEDRKAAIAELADEIKVLQQRVAELDKSVSDATVQRKQENEEFTELMSSNTAAKELLGFAKARLQKFYTPKLAPTEEPAADEEALVQTVHRAGKSRRDEPGSPPATWQGGYQKKTQENVGIISMIDLLIRDLDKEMIEAEKQEEMSQKAYEELMNESAVKRAKDVKSISMKTSSKADSEEMMTQTEGDVATRKKLFMATEQTVKQLHGECDWLLQNFDLRKTARADEMENLKGAKATLKGADFSLLELK